MQSHEGRLQTAFRIFNFAKMLTHSSAAYSPTLTQSTQSRLLYCIAGKLRRDGFFKKNSQIINISLPLNRKGLHSSVVPINLSSVESRLHQNNMQKVKWGKRKIKHSDNRISYTNVFKRPRKKILNNIG